MAWRLAESLKVLQDELDAAYPDRTTPDWSIGDAAHRHRPSDHNPNAAGVVCAIDVRQGGIDLGDVAEHIKQTKPHAVKYVIYNRRIWSRTYDSSGWRSYTGSNPHTTHMHVSVGRGGDGRSTGPYDHTGSWGISSTGANESEEGIIVSVKKGDGAGLDHDHPLREAVKKYQRLLVASGHDTVRDGDPEDWRYDGIYGDAMQAAVSGSREEFGAGNTDTERITGWHAFRLELKVYGG